MRKGLIISCLIFVTMFVIYGIFLTNCLKGEEGSTSLYIYESDTPADVVSNLENVNVRTTGFTLLGKFLSFKVRPGRYSIHRGDNIITVFRRLRNGQQEPINLVIPSVRTLDRLAGYLGNCLMMDSLSIMEAISGGYTVLDHHYTKETLPALFIPNTYQVYWNISLDDFMKRMQRENDTFWQGERDVKANRMSYSREQVVTLASIVDEETTNNAEKPMIAGMYIKRLSIGMPLQADPTVKFALGDFSLRRIYQKHLSVDSPYNTYKVTGLPPGPIRIASVSGIDAVLNYVPHDYIYMCAKEDFSGTHNFAKTYSEHLQNARRYAQALNQRNIK